MSTMIAVYYSSGQRRRCDKTCYGAAHLACRCVCGGANHGKGQEVATAQTRELAQSWLEKCREVAGDAAAAAKIPRAVAQAALAL